MGESTTTTCRGATSTAASTAVEAGEVLTVSWCVNADHGGNYAYRLCKSRPDLVAKLYDASPMSAADQEALEDCYQDGELRCDDVPGNDCGVSAVCADFPEASCNEPGRYFHCQYGASNNLCYSTGGSCGNGGRLVTDSVKIPDDFPDGPTVLTWRWESKDTPQVFHSCSDITISQSTAQSTPNPTAEPTAEPTPEPTPNPTNKPSPKPPSFKPTAEPTFEPTFGPTANHRADLQAHTESHQ